MRMPTQYVIIEELLGVIEDHGVKADIFGAAKIGYVVYPEIVLLSFTDIEVVVDPNDQRIFDNLVRKAFSTKPVRIKAPKSYDPSMGGLGLLKIMYDYVYPLPIEKYGFLRIVVAKGGLRDYFNPTRRVISLTRYLRMYNETPFEYSLAAKLLIPSEVFERGDCEEVIFGFMYSRDILPWSLSKLTKIVASIARREPRYGLVIAKNINEVRKYLETRLFHLLISEKKRVSRLLRYLDKIESTISHQQFMTARF